MPNSVTNSAVQSILTPVVFYVLLGWSVVWKGLALWRSARNKQKIWFIVILVANSVGVLEIIYILFFQVDKNNPNWKNEKHDKIGWKTRLKQLLPRTNIGTKLPLKHKKEKS